MRKLISIGLALVLGIVLTISPAMAAGPQWQADGALFEKVSAGVYAGGIGAVGPNASAMKKALAGAKKLFPGPIMLDGQSYVLTDGRAETAAVLVGLSGKTKGEVVAFANPYPPMGLVLGSYYVETGKFKEALTALDAGLALSPLPKAHLGSTVPDLLSERGIALVQLKRFKEAVASYDAGLAIRDMDKKGRALLYRGKGFVLTELGRLDEAEAAYKASLKFDPGNKIAKNELAYIAGLKAGMGPTGTLLTMPNANK